MRPSFFAQFFIEILKFITHSSQLYGTIEKEEFHRERTEPNGETIDLR